VFKHGLPLDCSTNGKESPSAQSVPRASFLLALFVAVSLSACDDIPTPGKLNTGCLFLGTRQGSLTPEFLARYAHWIPELKEGTCTSQVRLETPFFQVADDASNTKP
jgi:hypothetical protein